MLKFSQASAFQCLFDPFIKGVWYAGHKQSPAFPYGESIKLGKHIRSQNVKVDRTASCSVEEKKGRL
jgi:hypothetical protein